MKPKTQTSRVDRLILEEASEWFVDFRVGDVDATARERFDEWLRSSPEHIRAYMEIARTYVELPTLKVAGKVDVDALIAYAHSEENVVPFDSTHSERTQRPASMVAKPSHCEPEATGSASATPIPAPPRPLSCSCIAGAIWWNAQRIRSMQRTSVNDVP